MLGGLPTQRAAALALCLSTCLAAGRASAQTAVTVPFQGVLTNAAGDPITGTVAMTFALYDSQGAATSMWSETQMVQVGAVFPGVYSVQLGTVSSLTAELFAANANLYVGLRIGTDPELGRWPLGATPYAATAKAGLGGAGSGGTNDPDLRYVNVTGDTMTGRLNLPSNGLAVGTSQLVVSNARVGIGTASPAYPLHVSQGNLSKFYVSLYGNDTADWGRVDWGGGGTNDLFMLYALGNNKLRLGAGGSYDDMVITNTHRFGFGTTDPQSFFHVKGTPGPMILEGTAASNVGITFRDSAGDIGSLIVPGSASATAETVLRSTRPIHIDTGATAGVDLYINAAGVGIGTNAPTAKLDVRGNAAVGVNVASDNTDYQLSVSRHGTLATPGAYGTAFAPAILVNDNADDGPASLDVRGVVNINLDRVLDGDTNAANATILSAYNDNGSGLRVDGRGNTFVGFYNQVAPAGLARAFFVEGITGFGTRTPVNSNGNTRIDVNGAIAISGQQVLASDATTNYIGDIVSGDGVRNRLEFRNGDAPRMTLDGPNLGIGTTAPARRLDVVGDTRIQGNLEVTGNFTYTGANAVARKSGEYIFMDRAELWNGEFTMTWEGWAPVGPTGLDIRGFVYETPFTPGTTRYVRFRFLYSDDLHGNQCSPYQSEWKLARHDDENTIFQTFALPGTWSGSQLWHFHSSPMLAFSTIDNDACDSGWAGGSCRIYARIRPGCSAGGGLRVIVRSIQIEIYDRVN